MRLLQLSPTDWWTLKDATGSAMVFGTIGSGKTSGSAQALAKAYLSAGFGGLVLCTKMDEAETWLRYAKETGRENSIIHVREEEDFRFDFLDQEMTREGGGDPENILDLLIKVIEITQQTDMSGGDNAYFYDQCKTLMRCAISICSQAYGRVSLVDIYNIIASVAITIEQVSSQEWQVVSECFKTISLCNDIERRKQAELGATYVKNEELKIDCSYLLNSLPGYGDRLRGSITSIFTSSVDPWLRGNLRKLFCRKRDEINPATGEKGFYLDPDHCKDGAIYLFDYPVKSGLTGRLSQSLYKLVWQRHFERRNVKKDGGRPVFLFGDEAQSFIGEHDQIFAQTARSSRVLTVWLSQNISNFYTAFGNGEHGVNQTKSLLGNLATTIFHANGHEETNRYASTLFGSEWRYTASTTTGSSAGSSTSYNEQGSASSNDGTNSSTSVSEIAKSMPMCIRPDVSGMRPAVTI